jgi:hypothetical protein
MTDDYAVSDGCTGAPDVLFGVDLAAVCCLGHDTGQSDGWLWLCIVYEFALASPAGPLWFVLFLALGLLVGGAYWLGVKISRPLVRILKEWQA